MVCRPNRCNATFRSVDTESRSTGCGARNEATSEGTLVTPRGSLVMAAMKAGNLDSATPARGVRSWGTTLRRALTRRASPA